MTTEKAVDAPKEAAANVPEPTIKDLMAQIAALKEQMDAPKQADPGVEVMQTMVQALTASMANTDQGRDAKRQRVQTAKIELFKDIDLEAMVEVRTTAPGTFDALEGLKPIGTARSNPIKAFSRNWMVPKTPAEMKKVAPYIRALKQLDEIRAS